MTRAPRTGAPSGSEGADDATSAPDGGAHADLTRRLRAAGCVFAEDEAHILLAETTDDDELERRTVRRVAGEPLETIVGFVAFGGLRLAVEPGVFVPRQRTLFLARRAARAASTVAGARVAEPFSGVAPVAAYVRATVPGARLAASDIDPLPLRCARRNLGADAVVVRGDGLAGFGADATFDVIAAVVPYVPDGEIRTMPREATAHESGRALAGGIDGLVHVRELIASSGARLAERGVLLLEVHRSQVAAARVCARAHGLGLHARTAPDGQTTVIVVRHALA